jgi:tRNA(Ile)-lysidine synthase
LLLEALLKQQPVPEEAESALLYELVAPYGFHPTQIEAMLGALPLSGKRFEAQHFEAVIDHGELHVTSKEPETPQPEPAIIRAVRPRLAKEHYPAATDDFALFDADILPERLMLRHWREGDCFYPITNTGRAPKKKLQDFFSDLKLSVKQKNRTWLLCDADQPEEIIWVIGLRISDKYKITPDTARVAEIQIENP